MMIKTPLNTVLGGAFWTSDCTIVSGKKNTDQFIKSLFSDGSKGIYLNAQDSQSVSDLSSIKDLSGNENHALQPNSAKRPILVTDSSGYKSLKFDGIDDSLITNTINLSSSGKITVIAAVRKIRESAQFECLLNFGASATNGSFALMLSSAFTRLSFENKGTLARYAVSAPYTAPKSQVLTGIGDLQENKTILRTSGLQTAVDTSLGGGNYSNSQLFIGRRDGATQPAQMQLYALLVISKPLSNEDIGMIEAEFAKYAGVAL